MLERMRESSRNGLTLVFFAIITVVFAISFGAPMDGCTSSSGPVREATVNGYDVMSDEVGMVYYRYGDSSQNTSEAEIATERAKALKAVVLLHLLADEAREMGLRVTEDELLDYIRDPLRNAELTAILGGRLGIYRRYINNQLRVSQTRYQDFKEMELLARKFITLAEMQIGVLPNELEELDSLRNTKVNLEYIKISPQQIQDKITITDEEVADFTATDMAAIKAAYDEKSDTYSQPAQLQVRRIYILKPGDEADDAAKVTAAEKFEAAKARVVDADEDFGVVASEISEDFAKAKSGLMEWTAIENMDQNIVKALDGAEIGQVEVVETDFAYMIVKLEGRREKKVTPIAEVQDELARDLLRQKKAEAEIDALAARIQQALEGDDVTSLQEALATLQTPTPEQGEEEEEVEAQADSREDVASSSNPFDALSVKETGKFSLEGQDLSSLFGGQLPPGVSLGVGAWNRVPGIGESSEVALDAFALTEESATNGKIYDVENSKVLIRLKQKFLPETSEEDANDTTFYDELRAKRVNALSRGVQALFIVPQDEYGPFLENLYDEAVRTNKVTFNPDTATGKLMREKAPAASAAAAVVPAEEAAPAGEGDEKE